jgi:hypothetical protein
VGDSQCGQIRRNFAIWATLSVTGFGEILQFGRHSVWPDSAKCCHLGDIFWRGAHFFLKNIAQRFGRNFKRPKCTYINKLKILSTFCLKHVKFWSVIPLEKIHIYWRCILGRLLETFTYYWEIGTNAITLVGRIEDMLVGHVITFSAYIWNCFFCDWYKSYALLSKYIPWESFVQTCSFCSLKWIQLFHNNILQCVCLIGCNWARMEFYCRSLMLLFQTVKATVCYRVAWWFLFKPKVSIWVNFGGRFLSCNQGDQIGRKFAHGAIVYFGQVFEKLQT